MDGTVLVSYDVTTNPFRVSIGPDGNPIYWDGFSAEVHSAFESAIKRSDVWCPSISGLHPRMEHDHAAIFGYDIDPETRKSVVAAFCEVFREELRGLTQVSMQARP